MIDPELIAEGRALDAAATPGPWEVVEEIDGVSAGRKTVIKAAGSGDGRRKRVVTVGQTRQHHKPAEPNIELIAWMRNALPLLLDEVEGANIALGRLQEAVQADYVAVREKRQRDANRIAELEAERNAARDIARSNSHALEAALDELAKLRKVRSLAYPSADDMLGADPHWLGGQPVDEYIDETRGEKS